MDVLGFAKARARLGAVMATVVADHNPVAIARQKGGAVVLVSLADWQARVEVLYLSTPPGTPGELPRTIDELNAGGGA